MQVNTIPLPPTAQSITLSSQKLNNEGLTLGQQILARVVANQTANLVTLHIGNTILNAKTSIPLTQGQTLQLVVSQLGSEIILKPTQKAIETALLTQNMREVLPKEQPLQQVMSRLASIANNDGRQTANLPPQLVQAVRQFVKNLPAAKDLTTPQGLKKVLQAAGPFFENQLKNAANGQPVKDLGRDLKALLSRLREQIQQIAPDKEQSTARSPEQARPSSQTPLPASPQPQARPPAAQSGNGTATGSQTPAQGQTTANTAAPTPAPPSTTRGETTQTPASQSRETAANTPSTRAGTASTPANRVVNGSNTASPPSSKVLAQQATSQSLKPMLSDTPLPSTATGRTGQAAITGTQSAIPGPVQTNNGKPASQPGNVATSTTTQTTTAASQRLLNTVDMLGDLVKQVESSIARTQLHQLNSLTDQEQGKLAFTLEIPVQNKDELEVLKLKVEKDGKAGIPPEDVPLTVTIEVNLEHIGAVHARIVLLRENVALSFWAERESTLNLMTSHLIELQERLKQAGLSAENIQCHRGVPHASANPVAQTRTGLLDIKA